MTHFYRYTILAFVLIYLTACATSKVDSTKDELSEIKFYEAEDQSTFLSLSFYEFANKSKKIPAGYIVNGIILGLEDNSNNNILRVRPGEYAIEVGFPTYEWTYVTVNVEKGDSVAVKIFLEYDETPLH